MSVLLHRERSAFHHRRSGLLPCGPRLPRRNGSRSARAVACGAITSLPRVPSCLAARVGPAGHVVAADIDVSWMTAVTDAGYQVRRHDVGVEPPPGAGFDLVHARLVLVHVPQRAAALAAMISALRPGGRLL